MNIVYLLTSQAITVVLGILKSLILPVFLTIDNFGYWQIYLLYVGYLGVLGFGFNDGILLKYGKYNLEKLPKDKIGSSIKLFLCVQFLIMFIFMCYIFLSQDDSKKVLFLMVTLNIPLVILNGIFLSLFQSTNQIKKYSYFSIIDKLLMIILIIVLIFLDHKSAINFIMADFITRMIAIVFMLKEFSSFFQTKNKIFIKKNLNEIVDNSKAGSYILFSNLIAMLLIGYSLFLIERFMSIYDYSKYSLGISTTNIILVFITSISVFIFPNLSRLSGKKLNEKIDFLKKIISISSVILINVYFMIHLIISIFLDKYESILSFLPFIFLSIVVQVNYNILLVPYAKVLRKERTIFKLNCFMLIINVLLMTISIIFLKSLLITSIFMYITFYLRNFLLESILFSSKKRDKKSFFFNLFTHIFFVNVVYLIDEVEYAMILYVMFSITFLFVKFNTIKLIFKGDFNG